MIFFVGGIHGSGKGTLCKRLSEITEYPHYSASDLLLWNEVSSDSTNKKVKDISFTQTRLINGLKHVLLQHSRIILDGHFCLFNDFGEVERIEQKVFFEIAPSMILFVGDKPETIQNRLNSRDKRIYPLQVLNEMQINEQNYSKEVSALLEIPYFQLNSENLTDIAKFILNIS